MSPLLPFTAAQLLTKLRGQAGVTENPPGSNRTPYGAVMGMNGARWCAIFPAWGWHELGANWPAYWASLGTDLWAYTPALLARGRAGGLAVALNAGRPGDLVFFNFDADTGPEHVGTLIDVTGGILHTIEANTSSDDAGSQSNGGGVFERHRAPGLVCGILRPPYAPAGATTPARPAPRPQPAPSGLSVRATQTRLTALGYHPGPIDGLNGPRTLAAVKAFQHDRHLAVDGIVGPRTTAALAAAPAKKPAAAKPALTRTLRLTHPQLHGADVSTAQGMLERAGHELGRIDGIFGPRTAAAVVAYQRAAHLVADAIIGPNTAARLGFRWAG